MNQAMFNQGLLVAVIVWSGLLGGQLDGQMAARCYSQNGAGQDSAASGRMQDNPGLSKKELQQGWVRIFDGKSLAGWKAAENEAAFKIVESAIRVNGTRGHLYFMGARGDASFKDFHLKLTVKTEPKANSGVYFHSKFQAKGWPKHGYEAQVNRSQSDKIKTGSLYEAANVYEQHHEDNQWFHYEIIVKGREVQTLINGKVVNRYAEAKDVNFAGWPGRRLSKGTFALQAHDPGSVVWYKDIKVRSLKGESDKDKKAQGAGKRPNILFILADDQSPFDLKMYNPKSTLETPVLDRLAAKGVVIDGAYHMGSFSGAVCSPSRHMIMTGRSLWQVRKRSLGPDSAKLTLPAIFNRAGYDTMRTCKNGNSYNAANQEFTVRHDATKRGGDDTTGSAWHAEQVLTYLREREASSDSDPFLIYFGFSHPHDPRGGKPELLAKYGAVNHKDRESLPPANPKQPPLPVNYLPAHPFPDGHPGLRDEVKVSGVWQRRDERTIRNEIGRQYACSENIDIQIGRVLAQLEAMGELENTYVIYTADHGMAIGRHGLQGKQNLYEHTWRVPFIVKGPGVRHGRVQGNIYLLDVLATLCDLAGIVPTDGIESLSFRPVLEGKKERVRDVLYGAYCGGTKPGMRSVRRGDWKLIKYDVLGGKIRETQLFNLRQNPDELLEQHRDSHVVALTGNRPEMDMINLANDPKHAAILAEMELLLRSEMTRLGDPYRLWNHPAAK